ncbi:MAG TPA: SAM-dependent chlorinase/fluorinase, partial [bacterium]|nr:SAM-dependent chlorinase/fluorinase [bacterium]
MSHIITLTSDFGNADHYVGAMKGAILRINPNVTLVDISHEIPSFGVPIAAYVIGSSFLAFPRGTIHVVVTDPGVGTSRRPILLCTENYFFLAPDNGVLSLAAERDGARAIYHLDKPEYYLDHLSATFHG